MEEINIEDLTPQKIEELEYSLKLKDMYKCPKCRYIFDKENNTIENIEKVSYPVYDGFDNYHDEEYINETEQVKCPNCGYKDDEIDFPYAYTDDIVDAPNMEELVPGIVDYINNLENID